MPSPPGPPIPLNNPMEWEVTFTDATGVVFDPASGIEIIIEDPNGIITTYTVEKLEKVSVGVYSITVTGNVRGSWLGQGQGLLPDGTPITTEKVEQRVI